MTWACALLLLVPLALADQAPASETVELGWLEATSPLQPAVPDTVPRLLYFTASWCSPCRLLEREVFPDPSFRPVLAAYQLVHVDLESQAGQALSERFGVTTVPTLVAVAPDGQEIDRIRGYRSRRLLRHDLVRIRQGRGTPAELRRRLVRDPDDAWALASLGLRCYERLDLIQADSLLTAGLAVSDALDDTVAAAAGRALADLQRRRGDVAEAATTLTSLLERHPRHLYPRATWQQLADDHAAMGDSLAQVEALRGAARIEPLRIEPLVAFAEASARSGHCLDEAEEAARLAVELTGRSDPAAEAALARVLRRQGEYIEALVWIKRAVALAPDDPRWQRQRDIIHRAAIRGD